MNMVNIFAYFSWSNVKVSDVKDYASAALEENGFNSRGAPRCGFPITGSSAGWAASLAAWFVFVGGVFKGADRAWSWDVFSLPGP